jgi:succinate-acetate transporter protein
MPTEKGNEVSIANPASLGLGGFALTTFLLSLVNVGVLKGDSIGVVLGMAFLYGGLAQILAGMWEFKTGNIFGATCFTSYGAFWIGLALMIVLEDAKIIPAVPPAGLAAFLVAWGIFTLYATIATLRLNKGLRLLFAALTITYFLLAIGEYSATFKMIGGGVGLFVAVVAWYLSMAAMVNGVAKKTVLPS